MICNKCGLENPDENRFCEKCGEPLIEPEETKLVTPEDVQIDAKTEKQTEPWKTMISGDRKKITIIAALAIVAVCVIAIIVFSGGNKEAEYNEMIATADMYLQEADYEKAEDAYLEAINISPKEEPAYMKLADLYLSQGQYEDAVNIMTAGEEKIGRSASEDFQAKMEEVKARAMYGAYYQLCLEYQEKYGVGRYEGFGITSEAGVLMGLSVARLIDFDKDGAEELLVVYNDGSGFGSADAIKVEVWAWKNSELVNVLPATGISHGTDVRGWLEIIMADDMLLINIDTIKEMNKDEYLYYNGEAFATRYKSEGDIFSGPGMEAGYFIEGEKVSEEEYRSIIEAAIPVRNYDSDTPYFNENGEMFLNFLSIKASYAEQVFAETNRTLELLKPRVTVTASSVEAYESIIEMYRKMVQDGANMDWNSIQGTYGEYFNVEAAGVLSGEYWNKAYYALKDIDKNGVDELIIACGADIASRDNSNFYDFYTLKEGVPAKYFPEKLFGYRTNFGVYKDGTIWVRGSSSAWDTTIEYYRISDNGYTVDFIESIASVSGDDYGDGDREVLFYHEKNTREEITESQYNEIRDRYEDKRNMKFDWQRIQ